jgi:microcin C transport system substrate-binding protein
MTVAGFPQSASPGNEQLDYFGSAAARQPGSNNLIGLQDPAVDALLQRFVTFRHRAELVAASRALDRVLRAGYYLMPNWHLAYHRIAYRDIFGRPERLPRYFQAQDWVERTWWAKPGARP